MNEKQRAQPENWGKNGTIDLNHLMSSKLWQEFIEAKTFQLIKFIRMVWVIKIKRLFTQTNVDSISCWLRTFVYFIHFSIVYSTEILFFILSVSLLILNHQKSKERLHTMAPIQKVRVRAWVLPYMNELYCY